MKLSKKMILSALACFSMTPAFALPLGNPADPALYTKGVWLDNCYQQNCCDPCGGGGWLSKFNFRLGYYGDFVFERHLERDSTGFTGDFDHAEIHTNAGLVAVNFCNRFDVFATFGATHALIETQSDFISPLTGVPPRVEFELGTNFSWSVGGKAVLWQCGCTTLGLEGQYFRTNLDLIRATGGSLVSAYPSGIEAKYHEWQVGLGVAHKINFLVPYIGVKYSRAHADLGGAIVLANPVPDVKSKKHWGFVAGVTLIDCNAAGVTVEGRWADEKAVHVNGQIRF